MKRKLGGGSESLFLSCTFNRLQLRCRAVKMNLANEGLEKQREEEEKNTKKRKADSDKLWEGVSVHPILIYSVTRLPILMLIYRNRDTRGARRQLAQFRIQQEKEVKEVEQHPRLIP